MKRFFRVLLLITVIGIIYLSAQPGELSAYQSKFVRNFFNFPPKLLGVPFRKISHFLVFAVLGFFALLSMGKLTLNRFFLLLTGILFFAGLDEIHQSFIPKRIPDIRDVAIDFTGGYMGVAAAFILRKGFSRIIGRLGKPKRENIESSN